MVKHPVKNISIVKLGSLKRQVNIKKLQKWDSKLFAINSVHEITYMPQVEHLIDWQYLPDEEVSTNIRHEDNSDITIAITEYKLEGNFYMRRVENNVVAISLFEVGDILQNYRIPIEHFILKNIYEIVTMLHVYRNLPTTREGIPDIIHDETRSCLFDMHGIKTDVVYFFTEKPSLCPQCEANLLQKQLPENFLSILKKEIAKIRKPLFNRIYDFIKCHPVWAIIIAVASQFCIGLLGGLLANYLFYLLVRRG